MDFHAKMQYLRDQYFWNKDWSSQLQNVLLSEMKEHGHETDHLSMYCSTSGWVRGRQKIKLIRCPKSSRLYYCEELVEQYGGSLLERAGRLPQVFGARKSWPDEKVRHRWTFSPQPLWAIGKAKLGKTSRGANSKENGVGQNNCVGIVA